MQGDFFWKNDTQHKSGPLIHLTHPHSTITLLLVIRWKTLSLSPVYFRSQMNGGCLYLSDVKDLLRSRYAGQCSEVMLWLLQWFQHHPALISKWEAHRKFSDDSSIIRSIDRDNKNNSVTHISHRNLTVCLPGRKWEHVVTADQGECFFPMYTRFCVIK